MKNYKFLSGVLLVILLYLWTLPALAADTVHEEDTVPAPPGLELEAKGAILLDADTGDVLFRQNDQEALYPASTTKIMTCYLALKYLDVNAWVTLPEGISQGLSADASTAGLKAGEQLTVYDLLQCMMIVSANEAANAVALLVSGSISEFADLMNQEAEALGCTNTNFVNPNGLHDENHYTCASDLAIITRAALNYDVFRTICGTAEATIAATNLSEERTLSTTNYLLEGSTHPAYAYSGATGVKTGFTTQAGCCLVATAYLDGRTLLSVVLGAEKTEDADGEEVIGSFTETTALFSWGFSNYDTALLYQQYLDALPEETAEPSPSPTPEETAEPSPSPTPEPSPSPTPEATEETSPSPAAEPTPSPASEQTGRSESGAAEMVAELADFLGISAGTLLLAVLAVTGGLLVLAVTILICLIRRNHRR